MKRDVGEHSGSQALAFLRQVIPKAYLRDIENCITLDEGLVALRQWSQSEAIHAETIISNLKAIVKGANIYDDRKNLSALLQGFTRVLDVEPTHHLSIAHAAPYLYKLSNDQLYNDGMRTLDDQQVKRHDGAGALNYISVFLQVLHCLLRQVQSKLSVMGIDTLFMQSKPQANRSQQHKLEFQQKPKAKSQNNSITTEVNINEPPSGNKPYQGYRPIWKCDLCN